MIQAKRKFNEPQYATILLGKNEKLPIIKIHYKTKQVTLKEGEKIYNTVSFKNVIFDFDGLTERDILLFKEKALL